MADRQEDRSGKSFALLRAGARRRICSDIDCSFLSPVSTLIPPRNVPPGFCLDIEFRQRREGQQGTPADRSLGSGCASRTCEPSGVRRQWRYTAAFDQSQPPCTLLELKALRLGLS